MKKWKAATIIGAIGITLTIGGMAAFADTNIISEPESVKVLVGAVEHNSTLAKKSFINERNSIISENQSANPFETKTALITFDSYLTIEEAEEYVATLSDSTVKQIFLGIPNIDGRTIISSGSGDLSERIALGFDSMLAKETSSEGISLISAYKDNAQIFALTIETTNSEIAEINQMDAVAFVDVYDYPEAERLAEIRNVPVSYIAVPEKPDNSH